MSYSHLHVIPGFKTLVQKLGQDALAIPVVSDVRRMAFSEAEYVFSELVNSVKPAVLEHVLRLAISFGKDSTFLLAVFVEAYRQVIQSGQKPKAPLIVTHADTRIESPVMAMYACRQIRLLKSYLNKHGIPHEIYTAKPADRYSWPVMYVGGLKLITVGASKTADCSVELKQRPLQGVESQLAKKYGNQIVTVTGVRSSESAARKQTLIDLGLNTGEIIRTEKNGVVSLDYAPIAHVTTDEVWMVLRCLGEGAVHQYGRSLPYWGKSTWYLSKLYVDQTDGSCPIVGSGVMSNARSGGCSSSLRSGCSLCTTVNVDKQASVLSDMAQYPQLKNLLSIRNWLSHTYFDMNYRRFIGRKINDDGYVKIGPETFNEKWLSQVLRWLLQADADEIDRANTFSDNLKTEAWLRDTGVQAILAEDIAGWQKLEWISEYLEDMREPTFELVSPSQLLLIDVMWSRDGYSFLPFSALNIWHDIYHLGVRVDYPVIEGKKAPNNIPASRYLYVGDHPSFAELTDINNSAYFSRFISELDAQEFVGDACGVEKLPRMESSVAVSYGGQKGKTFDGWFGDYETKPLVVAKMDEDDSGYVIDADAAEMITSFMIKDYLRVYRTAEREQHQAVRVYRSNYALRRLIREGVLRLSAQAQRNTARLAARAWLYEDIGLLAICSDSSSGLFIEKTISDAEYKSIIQLRGIPAVNDELPAYFVLQQLTDIKTAAKSARELYKLLCHSRSVAMLSIAEMGPQFVFDGRWYQSQVATQTVQVQEIVNTLTSVNGILSLLPTNAPLRQQKALPLSVSKILSDFASQLRNEFMAVELNAWMSLLDKLEHDITAVNEQFSVLLSLQGMAFIKNAKTATDFVKAQIAMRNLKKAV